MKHIGLDIGSTTVKIVVMDEKLNTIYTSYQRHFSDTKKTIIECMEELMGKYENEDITIALTGSRSFGYFRIFRSKLYTRSSCLQKVY